MIQQETAYEPPVLFDIGDFEELTLGSSGRGYDWAMTRFF